ncbi:MAG: carbon-nitrogen hydrolase family protein [Gammaproteobacteria bacterium]|nr:carbon-nitrogen hydrolase family protein [Gammaproteobacteria bacterium]
MRTAVVQMRSTADVEANLDSAARLVDRAADLGAEIALLPEAFAYIGPGSGKQAILEPLPGGGPILERCRRLARDRALPLLLGGFHERAADGRAHNTAVHLDATGEIVALYRKIHLFDVDLADGTRLAESDGTAPGAQAVVTQTAFGTLGLTICYDVRFPALYQALVDRGAVAIAVPSAFTASTGKDHWHVLLRARAIECQAYVLAPAQWGSHGQSRSSYGHSLIVDPWGCVIAECSDGEGVAVAELDIAKVNEARRGLPSLQHRRQFEH